MTNIRQGVIYADAETRGKLRMWKKKLAQNFTIFNNFFQQLQGGRLQSLGLDMVESAGLSRKKAYNQITKGFGPGIISKSFFNKRNHSLAIWSIMTPRDPVIVQAGNDTTESERASLLQDCVTVNYVLVGRIEDRLLVCDGLWTLEVPDHALGRAVERSRLLQPEVLIREAHNNLLDLPMTAFEQIANTPAIYIKAGAGCFVGHFNIAEDVSIDHELTVSVRVKTWLSDKQLHEDQIALTDKGKPGERLGDSWLKPRPLLRLEREGDKVGLTVWSPKNL